MQCSSAGSEFNPQQFGLPSSDILVDRSRYRALERRADEVIHASVEFDDVALGGISANLPSLQF